MRAWLLSIALGIVLFNAPPAQADAPQQIIDQIANLRVQDEELRHLQAMGKLTIGDAVTKKAAIEAQINAVWLPYRGLPPADATKARMAADRLVADKLSLLRPQWAQEEAALKVARDQHNKQLRAESEDDSRAAAELQRQRVGLQKELAAGTLTQDAFNAKDKQASDAIAAYRKKYDDAGEQWPLWFDQRYRVLLEAALKNPDTPLPQPTVPAESGGPAAAPPDFAADVKTAADLAVKREENSYKFDKKQINQTLMANTDAVINLDLARLKARYDALVPQRGAEFADAYMQAAAPRIEALKAEYYPERYRPPPVSAPVAQQDNAPVTAPVSPPVPAPVALNNPPVAAPVSPPVSAPVVQQNSAPVAAPVPPTVSVPASVAQNNAPPVIAPSPPTASAPAALNNPPVAAPVSPPVPAPVAQNNAPPVIAPVSPVVPAPVAQQNNASVAAPVSSPVPAPVAQNNAPPVIAPAPPTASAPAAQQNGPAVAPPASAPVAPQNNPPVAKPVGRVVLVPAVLSVPTPDVSHGLLILAALGIAIAGLIFWMWRSRDHVAEVVKGLFAGPRQIASVIAAVVVLALLSSVVSTTVAVVIGVVMLGIFCFRIWRLAKAARRRRASNQTALSQFGTTQEERSKNIESTFDKRAVDMEFDLNADGIKCRFFRSLSAMGAREREVLRTAYHLYNFGEFGNEMNFYIVRFALVYGDGKAVITGNSKYPTKYSNISSMSDALKWYQGSNGPEAMINLTLNWLQGTAGKSSDDPILRKLSSRLHGDGGDLAPGAPLVSGTKGELVAGSLILGLDEKAHGTWWCYDGEGSLITIAPPGSGKTQSQVFPNLLMWKGAAVVLDVKGDIYEQTSKWRRENVGPVYKFSPLDPATSHGYNPLAEVRADPDYLWEDARFLADMMIVPSGAKDPFWEHRARDVLTAAIARVCLEEDVAKRSMGDVLDVLHGVGWEKFVTYLEARIDFPSMSRAGHSLASMEQKTRDGVLQSALSSMSAWDGERIARATRKSDWSPLDLRGGTNPTIYICLKPNEVDSYISLLRVFIAQHIRALTSTKVPAHGAQSILFMLDELPRLKHMPPVEEALEIGRQYGIKLWLFAQSLGQLGNAYPNAEGMIGGCAIRMFMNPSLHDETAQKVSDDIGFMDSVIDGTRVKIVEPNVLAGPDYKDVVIVMAANARAARLRKYLAYEDDALRARMGTLRLAESLPS